MTGSVSFERISGALLLCGQWGPFEGCGLADAGRLIFLDRLPSMPPSAFYGAAGVRVARRVDRRAQVHAHAEKEPRWRDGELELHVFAGSNVFQAAGPGVGLSLGFHAELPWRL